MVKIGNRVLVNGVWVLDGCMKCMEYSNKICKWAAELAFDDNTFLSCDYFSIVSSYNFYKSARPLTFPMKCVEWHIMCGNQCYCENCNITYFPRECCASNNLKLIGYTDKCPHCGGEPEYMEDIFYEHLYDCAENDIFGSFIEDIDYSIDNYLDYINSAESFDDVPEDIHICHTCTMASLLRYNAFCPECGKYVYETEDDEDYSIDEYLNYLDWIEYFDHSFSEEDYPYIPAFHDPLYDKRCWMQPKELCVFLDNCGNSCVYCKSCPDYKDCVRVRDNTL